jgi:hypothetical protein
MASQNQQKDTGVLYLRYEKASLCGVVIENLKQDSNLKKQLNERMLRLIYLAEVIEIYNFSEEIDPKILNDTYYEALQLFLDKLNRVRYQINTLSSQVYHQGYRDANLIGVQSKDPILWNTRG